MFKRKLTICFTTSIKHLQLMAKLYPILKLLVLFACIQAIILLTIHHLNQVKENTIENGLQQTASRSSLFDIGMKHHTDKVYLHHYETLYEKYLSRYRDTAIRLLEIGLGCGMVKVGASAETWREYLGPTAEIHFLEINATCGKLWEDTTGREVRFHSAENILISIDI